MRASRGVLLFIVALLLQWWWNSHLAYWGVAPQFLLAFTVLIASRRGPVFAMLVGYAWGLCADVQRADLFGSDALLYAFCGYLAGMVRWQIDLQAAAPLAVAVLVLSGLYEVLRGLVGWVFVKSSLWNGWFPALVMPPLNALVATAAAIVWDLWRDL